MSGDEQLAGRGLLAEAEVEARRRGHHHLDTEHLALALARLADGPSGLLAELQVDWLHWRDEINRLLGANEGRAAQREGRHAGTLTESPADRWYDGPVTRRAGAAEVVRLARQEATANDTAVGPAELLVGLLEEGNGIAAGTGRWFGLTAHRVRQLADLQQADRPAVAPISDPTRTDRLRPPRDLGPLVLHGGGPVPDRVFEEARRLATADRAGSSETTAVLVDVTWHTRPPQPRPDDPRLVQLRDCGFDHAPLSGMVDRPDGADEEVCRRLAAADLIWLALPRMSHQPVRCDPQDHRCPDQMRSPHSP